MPLVLFQKSHCHTQCHLDFLLCYIIGALYFHILHLVLWFILNYVFVKSVGSVFRFFFFFLSDCPVFPALFVERLSYSTAFIPLSKISWLYLYGFISGLCSVALIYLSILSPIPNCLDDCSFTIRLEVRECQSSNFAPLL